MLGGRREDSDDAHTYLVAVQRISRWLCPSASNTDTQRAWSPIRGDAKVTGTSSREFRIVAGFRMGDGGGELIVAVGAVSVDIVGLQGLGLGGAGSTLRSPFHRFHGGHMRLSGVLAPPPMRHGQPQLPPHRICRRGHALRPLSRGP